MNLNIKRLSVGMFCLVVSIHHVDGYAKAGPKARLRLPPATQRDWDVRSEITRSVEELTMWQDLVVRMRKCALGAYTCVRAEAAKALDNPAMQGQAAYNPDYNIAAVIAGDDVYIASVSLHGDVERVIMRDPFPEPHPTTEIRKLSVSGASGRTTAIFSSTSKIGNLHISRSDEFTVHNINGQPTRLQKSAHFSIKSNGIHVIVAHDTYGYLSIAFPEQLSLSATPAKPIISLDIGLDAKGLYVIAVDTDGMQQRYNVIPPTDDTSVHLVPHGRPIRVDDSVLEAARAEREVLAGRKPLRRRSAAPSQGVETQGVQAAQ